MRKTRNYLSLIYSFGLVIIFDQTHSVVEGCYFSFYTLPSLSLAPYPPFIGILNLYDSFLGTFPTYPFVSQVYLAHHTEPFSFHPSIPKVINDTKFNALIKIPNLISRKRISSIHSTFLTNKLHLISWLVESSMYVCIENATTNLID